MDKGIKKLKVQKELCPFCNKKYRPSIFKKWHGLNCKMNNNEK